MAEKRNNKNKKEKSASKVSPTSPQLVVDVCLRGERMAWGDGEMEGKECWLGNARGRRRHRGIQRDVA